MFFFEGPHVMSARGKKQTNKKWTRSEVKRPPLDQQARHIKDRSANNLTRASCASIIPALFQHYY
jgi:hypothetical protein